MGIDKMVEEFECLINLLASSLQYQYICDDSLTIADFCVASLYVNIQQAD